MKKNITVSLTILILCLLTTFPSFAGSWQEDNIGWWWQKDDGNYPANQWQWLDGNNDGISECYYFDSNGYMLFNTTTPDGYAVNSTGAWTIDGTTQTQIILKDGIKSTETGFIKQEYLDALGKNRDYVISWFGNTEDKSISTYGSDVYEYFYYTKETGDMINISLDNNKVTEISYISMNHYDITQEQQIMKKIDNQFGVKSQKTDYNDSVWYTWIISNNPNIELIYFMGGSYTLRLDTY